LGYPSHEPAEVLVRSTDLNFHLFAYKDKVEEIMTNNTLPHQQNNKGITIIICALAGHPFEVAYKEIHTER
jgi:hypothetical protein